MPLAARVLFASPPVGDWLGRNPSRVDIKNVGCCVNATLVCYVNCSAQGSLKEKGSPSQLARKLLWVLVASCSLITCYPFSQGRPSLSQARFILLCPVPAHPPGSSVGMSGS